MRIELYGNWKTIVTKAWSCRFLILLGALLGAETLLPSFEEVLPRSVYSALTLAAIVSRLIVQKEVDDEQG